MKNILLIAVLMSCYFYSNAQQIEQENNSKKDDFIQESRLVQNTKNYSFSAFGGYTENGFTLLGCYNFHNSKDSTKQHNFIELSVLASFINEDISSYEIPVHNYTLNIGYFKKVTMLSGMPKEFTTSIGVGGLLGYESINSNTQELPNGVLILDKSKFIYGGFIGANVNIFLSEQFDLTAKSNLYYHPNSDVGQTKIFVGIGIKYLILKNKKQ